MGGDNTEVIAMVPAGGLAKGMEIFDTPAGIDAELFDIVAGFNAMKQV